MQRQDSFLSSVAVMPDQRSDRKDEGAQSVHVTPERDIPLSSLFVHFFASSSRLCFAHELSDGTGFMGGPPSVPQEHGPSVLASVMQEQDIVFKQAHTYTSLVFFFAFFAAPARVPPCAGIRANKHAANIAVASPTLDLVFFSMGLLRGISCRVDPNSAELTTHKSGT
jgi:hypothetical protein